MILQINPQYPTHRHVQSVVQSLKEGKIVAYPTDTAYAIGCDVLHKKALHKIYELKKEKKQRLFSFICHDFKTIGKYAHMSNYAFAIIKSHLPGPYTFILNATREIPTVVLTKRKTIGIRMPNSPLCLEIARLLGNPLLTTTAKHWQWGILNSANDIQKIFGSFVDIIIDGDILQTNPSSVIDLTDDTPKVIRQGAGDIDEFA